MSEELKYYNSGMQLWKVKLNNIKETSRYGGVGYSSFSERLLGVIASSIESAINIAKGEVNNPDAIVFNSVLIGTVHHIKEYPEMESSNQYPALSCWRINFNSLERRVSNIRGFPREEVDWFRDKVVIVCANKLEEAMEIVNKEYKQVNFLTITHQGWVGAIEEQGKPTDGNSTT